MILQLLNVLIGLTLIYVIFSSVASALFEIAEHNQWRDKPAWPSTPRPGRRSTAGLT